VALGDMEQLGQLDESQPGLALGGAGWCWVPRDTSGLFFSPIYGQEERQNGKRNPDFFRIVQTSVLWSTNCGNRGALCWLAAG
jgi:hypothetical protein